ncbi:hypothetical protein F4818DRAFT_118241 [Hypoxylon cercidicola]|nr:hypothetical protein F4818DRAFT_118241 [Hypoxylon cercidicola]
MSPRQQLPTMLNFFQHREALPASKFSHLLSFVEGDDREDGADKSTYKHHADAFANAPIFAAAVDKFIHTTIKRSSTSPAPSTSTTSSASSSESPEPKLIPQYGLIGMRQDVAGEDALAEDRLVLANMNMPWSAFICGSQGAGKSHTLSCLLENALVANNAAGSLPHPLAGMVLHYDHYASYSSAQICEQAYICSSGIPVTVLVSPSNIWAMKRLYENLPGLKPGVPKPKVLPLYLNEDRLDIQTILKLMAVDSTAKSPPLYMEIVLNIAREIAMEGPGFSCSEFRDRLSRVAWMRGQDTALNLRLQLIDTIIAPSPKTKTTRPAPAQQDIWSFAPGSLTIVDLSDPFFSSDDACTLFSICLSIFLEERHKCGRVVVLDEAHKFLAQSGEAEVLTNDLLSIIRQQRHLGTRVFIATQEPTLSPKLIDLANATFVHRFLSPSWYKALEEHLAGASKEGSSDKGSLFDEIVSLRTGEALLFCPTAQLDVVKDPEDEEDMVKPLGKGHAKIKIRKRLTADGGKSIAAAEVLADTSTHTGIDDVPMHLVVPKPEVKKEKEPAKVVITKQQTNAAHNVPTNVATNNKTTPKSSPAKVPTNVPTTNKTTSKSSPSNSNISRPTPAAPGTQRRRELKNELRKRARERFEGNWSSFKALTPGQIAQMCSDIDTAFKISPGTTAQIAYSKGQVLNVYLAKLKENR